MNFILLSGSKKLPIRFQALQINLVMATTLSIYAMNNNFRLYHRTIGVFLFVWNKSLKARPQLILPPEELFESGPNGFYYLFAVNWILIPKTSADTGSGDGHEYLIVIWANRLQNRVIVTVCQPEQNLPCITVFTIATRSI